MRALTDVDKQHIMHEAAVATKASGIIGAGTVPVGWWVWLGENNSEIGAACAIVGASCAVVSLVFGVIRGRRR